MIGRDIRDSRRKVADGGRLGWRILRTEADPFHGTAQIPSTLINGNALVFAVSANAGSLLPASWCPGGTRTQGVQLVYCHSPHGCRAGGILFWEKSPLSKFFTHVTAESVYKKDVHKVDKEIFLYLVDKAKIGSLYTM